MSKSDFIEIYSRFIAQKGVKKRRTDLKRTWGLFWKTQKRPFFGFFQSAFFAILPRAEHLKFWCFLGVFYHLFSFPSNQGDFGAQSVSRVKNDVFDFFSINWF